MKHTIKLGGGEKLVIEPLVDAIRISAELHGVPLFSRKLEDYQVGVLMFALEQAEEDQQVMRQRATAGTA